MKKRRKNTYITIAVIYIIIIIVFFVCKFGYTYMINKMDLTPIEATNGSDDSSSNIDADIASKTELYLSELPIISKDCVAVDSETNTSTITDNYGTTYEKNFYSSNNVGSIKYNLNGQYNEFDGTIYVTQAGRAVDESDILCKDARIQILGDDMLLYEGANFSPKDKTQNISINVTGIYDLEIRFVETQLSFYDTYLALGNGMVKKTNSSAAANGPYLLTDSNPFTANLVYIGSNVDRVDNIGNCHPNNFFAYRSIDNEEVYIEYKLDKKYTEFEFLLYVPRAVRGLGYDPSGAIVEIYADDRLVGSFSGLSSTSSPETHSVDVSNADFLKIVFKDFYYFNEGSDHPYVLMAEQHLWK